MKIRRVPIIIAAIAVAIVTLLASFPKQAEPPFTPNFGVGFHGYTNDILGKRLARVSVTNLLPHAVRLRSVVEVEYGPPLSGTINSADLVEAMMEPGGTIAGVVFERGPVSVPPGPKWRLHLRASRATTKDRFVRWWDELTNRHPWTWYLPFPFSLPPEGQFTSEWLGP